MIGVHLDLRRLDFGLTHAGCVLRTKSVEVFEAQRGMRGMEFSKLVSVPIVNPEREGQLAEAIRQALAEARIKTRWLGVCVASPDVLLRSFALPSLPKAEWAAAVQFEARKHIPFKTEDLVWDFSATEQRSSKQLEVVFLGLRADTFGRIQSALHAAAVTPSFVEPQAASLARWTMHSVRNKPSEFAGLVDIEPDGAHIVLAKDQVPYFSRDVSFSQAGTAAAGLGLGPGFGALTSITRQGAVLGEASGALEPSAPDPRAEVLLSELRVSLDFFMRENPASSIGRIWLFGEETLLNAWCPWLTRQLGYPVEPGHIPILGRAPLSNLQFACSAGLAFRDLPGARVKLQLTGHTGATAGAKAKPAETGWRAQLAPLLKPAVAQLMVALVFLGVLKLMGNRQLASARAHNMAIVNSFPDPGFKLAGKNKSTLLTMQKDLDRRLVFLRKVTQQRLSASEQLEILARALPDGVWLESVNFVSHSDSDKDKGAGQAKLVIQGACFLRDPDKELVAIRDFARRLKDTQGFAEQFTSADVGEIMSATDRPTQLAFKRFRLDCGLGR